MFEVDIFITVVRNSRKDGRSTKYLFSTQLTGTGTKFPLHTKNMKQFSLLLLLPFFSFVAAAPIFSRDINTFLAEIALLFPFSGLISDISGLLIAAEQTLAFLFGIQTTQNGLSGSCGAVTVIFARGTTEPGNVGVLVGPPFFDALRSTIGAGNVVVQGVDYPASIEGFLAGGDSASAQTMYANLPILEWASRCWYMC
jgi:hypothetical protein